MPLIVKPIQANLTKDKDFLGKSDPYCIILIGNEKQRTRTCSGGGKYPKWSDTFQFNSTDQMLRVQVWDDDALSDDMIGEGNLNLTQLYQNPNRTENQYIDLIHRGKSAGRVLISLQYQGANMSGGWGGNQQGGWNNPPQQGWGGQQQGGWNNPPQQGWGGQQGGWGNQAPQQGWGGQQAWGNQGGWR